MSVVIIDHAHVPPHCRSCPCLLLSLTMSVPVIIDCVHACSVLPSTVPMPIVVVVFFCIRAHFHCQPCSCLSSLSTILMSIVIIDHAHVQPHRRLCPCL